MHQTVNLAGYALRRFESFPAQVNSSLIFSLFYSFKGHCVATHIDMKIVVFIGLFLLAPSFSQSMALKEVDDSLARSKTYDLDVFNKFIGFWAFTGASNIVGIRSMGYGVPANGWNHFKTTYVDPAIERGWKRLWIHNPFGRTDGKIMEYCQYKRALEHRPPEMAHNMTAEFVPVWQDVLSRGIEVTMYLGGPHNDVEMQPLVDNPELWWEHARECMQPLLDVGITSLAVDNSAPRYPEESVRSARTVELVRWWKENRGSAFVEARPRVNTPHWFDGYGVYAFAATWDRQSPEQHEGQEDKHAFEWQMNGEALERVEIDNENPTEWTLTKQALLDTHTVVYTPSNIYHRAHGNFGTLENFIRHLSIDIPSRIDLAPTAPTENGHEYIIVDGPHFGTLTPFPFDPTGSVFKYTPSLFFVGTDVIRFKVKNGAAESSVQTITINSKGLEPANQQRISVNGGDNQTVRVGETVALQGSVNSAKSATSLWAVVSGPGSAHLQTTAPRRASAVFSMPGEYVLRFTAATGDSSNFDEVTITVVNRGDANAVSTPNAVETILNVISPTSREAEFRLTLDANATVKADIYNRSGEFIRNLADREMSFGTHPILWDGKSDNGDNVSSGTYTVLFDVAGTKVRKRAVVIR